MRAHKCVHAQHVKTCTQLREVNKPSYLSQMKSDLHKTFSVCQGWSLELIDSIHDVGGHAHVRLHAQHIKMCMQLGTLNKPSYFS